MTFNPFNVDPERVRVEIAEGGLDVEEQNKAAGAIKEEIVKALADQILRWKAL